MNTQEVIYRLRTNMGLSQDELAEKVFVTRQAVSRWEIGDTVPNTETLKLLSRLFNVSINTLLGSPQKLICQCCGMPLDDTIIGRDRDGTPNEHYCQWCYADGTYTYSDMDDLIDICVRNMVSEDFTEEQARALIAEGKKEKAFALLNQLTERVVWEMMVLTGRLANDMVHELRQDGGLYGLRKEFLEDYSKRCGIPLL